jgi:octanoyl-[GcvH]:protein N-octanoyltransferase
MAGAPATLDRGMGTGLRSWPSGVVRLLRTSFPEPPALDTAVSHAILRGVSDGSRPQTLRTHRPGPIVAFGPLDRLSPGYGRAVEAARSRGFGAVQRLAGGRAAVFHPQTIAFSWAIPDPQPRLHIGERFEEVSAIMVAALRDLGVDARVGEVPGEYCPGEHSVNARGKTKLVGVGQRILLRAAHVGGVVVVGESDRVRDVLIPVYQALELDWNPATTGSVEDEVPGVRWEDVEGAILSRFRESYDLVDDSLPAEMMTRARELQLVHEVMADQSEALR